MARLITTLVPAGALCLGLFLSYLLTLAVGADPISWNFLLGLPAVAGVVFMYFRPAHVAKSLAKTILWLVGISFGAILLAVGFEYEGLICVTMALLPIVAGLALGGIVYLMVRRWRDDVGKGIGVVAVPALAIVALSHTAVEPRVYDITNMVVIDAPRDAVFEVLHSIPDIAPGEVPTKWAHRLGVPKPTSAVWMGTGVGALRQSNWSKDVQFHEIITHYVPGEHIAWRFEFPDGWIAEGIEDPHVKVGGPHFNILTGAYSLTDADGGTRLTLTTRTYDNSGLGGYARFWHEFFFEDFHDAILQVVKARAETRFANG